jgi:hypothetical protein
MTVAFQFLCTLYFAALLWAMYSVMSTSTPTSRSLLLGVVAATVLVVGLHFALGAPLGMTEGRNPADRFSLLCQFCMMLVVLQVGNRLMRSLFAHRTQRIDLPKASTEKLLTVNAFMANKAIYVLIYLYLVLGIWIPKIL